VLPFSGLISEEDITAEDIAKFRLATLFGLTPEDKIDVLMEPIFLLMYYMGFTWESFGLGALTTEQRRWFVGRLNKEIEQKINNGNTEDIPTKGAHHNQPDIREMAGRFKPFNQNPRTSRPT
jgi:hypothetical protein